MWTETILPAASTVTLTRLTRKSMVAIEPGVKTRTVLPEALRASKEELADWMCIPRRFFVEEGVEEPKDRRMDIFSDFKSGFVTLLHFAQSFFMQRQGMGKEGRRSRAGGHLGSWEPGTAKRRQLEQVRCGEGISTSFRYSLCLLRRPQHLLCVCRVCA